MPDVTDELAELSRLDGLTSEELDEELRARGIALGPVSFEPVGVSHRGAFARPRATREHRRRLLLLALAVEAVVGVFVAMHYLHLLP
jgi:hypothetical protein